MAVDVKVPVVGESITEVFIASWLKKPGEAVAKDEPLVELETDKATLEVPATVDGVVAELLKAEGDSAAVGEVIARIEEGAEAPAPDERAAPAPEPETPVTETPVTETPATETPAAETAGAETPKAETPAAETPPAETAGAETPAAGAPPAGERAAPAGSGAVVMPAAQRVLEEHGLSADDVRGSGPGGRILKEDVHAYLAERERRAAEGERAEAEPAQEPGYERREERVPMSPLRRTIAQRLVSAQHEAALLTTFNEIDMSAVITLRKEYREPFEARYGVRLGFMSFFVKAAIDALKLVPQLNAEIRESHIVYKNFYDIGVAVSAKKGLVVPVIRNAERLSFAQIEETVGDFGRRAADNKLTPDELQGGTFTISNGGVFGSLLSTPIVNPPQSGVLGMHAIQERPVAVSGQVEVRPMMYVALTYDHRIVDGREAVTFLKRIKDAVESPARMLLEV